MTAELVIEIQRCILSPFVKAVEFVLIVFKAKVKKLCSGTSIEIKIRFSG